MRKGLRYVTSSTLKRKMLRFSLLCCALLFVPATRTTAQEALRVFAAASLTDAVADICREFTAGTGIPCRMNNASSSTLARQIVSGAEADLFISANVKWAEYVRDQGFADPEKYRILLGNSLVMIVPKNETTSNGAGTGATSTALSGIRMEKDFDLAGSFEGRLSLGDPDHVPAGIYAREALISLGWWDSLEDRLLPAANVREALLQVELGEVQLGIVYKTDATLSQKVEILAEFPASSLAEPISYVALVTQEASSDADDLFAFLRSKEAGDIFTFYGFSVIDPSTP